MSLILGIVGIIQDRSKWLAISVVIIALLLGMIWIGLPVLFSLCS